MKVSEEIPLTPLTNQEQSQRTVSQLTPLSQESMIKISHDQKTLRQPNLGNANNSVTLDHNLERFGQTNSNDSQSESKSINAERQDLEIGNCIPNIQPTNLDCWQKIRVVPPTNPGFETLSFPRDLSHCDCNDIVELMEAFFYAIKCKRHFSIENAKEQLQSVNDSSPIIISKGAYKTLNQRTWLNDEAVNFMLRLIGLFSTSKRQYKQYHIFPSTFMQKLMNKDITDNEAAKNVNMFTHSRKGRRGETLDIFEKKLLFFPYCCQVHWSLLVLVNTQHIKNAIGYNEATQRLTYPPINDNDKLTMLLHFDSLDMHPSEKIRDRFLHWLNHRWTSDEKNIWNWNQSPPVLRIEHPFTKFNCSLHKFSKDQEEYVPVQENNYDCGIFTSMNLYSILHFVDRNFTRSECAISDDKEVIPFKKMFQELGVFSFQERDGKEFRKQYKLFIVRLIDLQQEKRETIHLQNSKSDGEQDDQIVNNNETDGRRNTEEDAKETNSGRDNNNINNKNVRKDENNETYSSDTGKDSGTGYNDDKNNKGDSSDDEFPVNNDDNDNESLYGIEDADTNNSENKKQCLRPGTGNSDDVDSEGLVLEEPYDIMPELEEQEKRKKRLRNKRISERLRQKRNDNIMKKYYIELRMVCRKCDWYHRDMEDKLLDTDYDSYIEDRQLVESAHKILEATKPELSEPESGNSKRKQITETKYETRRTTRRCVQNLM